MGCGRRSPAQLYPTVSVHNIRRMNISIVSGPWLPVPPLQGGAVPRLWQGLAENFAAKGHDVTILARAYKEQPRYEVLNGVKYIRRGGFSQSRHIVVDLFKDFAYALRTTSLLPAADIVVVNDFWIPVLAQWLRPNAGKIVIAVGRFPKGQFFLYSRAARLVAVSNVIREAIVEQCQSLATRVRVFPNPTDTDIFSPPVPPRANRDDKTILYVGRIHPEKGIHLLIDAFALIAKKSSRVRLQIVGPVRQDQGGGGAGYFKELQSKADGINVQFLDPVFEQSRLAEVYRKGDLFCYPSLAEKGEAFPVAPLEAMATGLVPVVSDLKCFRDLIDEGQTGYYFDHRGVDAVAKLFQILRAGVLNREQTSQMSKEAVRKASNFSYDRIGSLYLEDFEELLSTPTRESHRLTNSERVKPERTECSTKSDLLS